MSAALQNITNKNKKKKTGVAKALDVPTGASGAASKDSSAVPSPRNGNTPAPADDGADGNTEKEHIREVAKYVVDKCTLLHD
jgi:hypothetical protein